MKNQTDEKQKKKVTKKAKKARSVVMMLLMCILLLSAATYAWFSLSNTARVNNLTMTVSEANGLRVALDKGSTPAEQDWKGSISLDSDNGYNVLGLLKPATTANGKDFYRPVYNDEGEVSDLTQDGVVELNKENKDPKSGKTNTATTEGHYCKYTFYMQSLKEDANVRLVAGKDLANASRTGTYLVQKEDAQKDAKNQSNAAAAMRISIYAGDSNYGIYEPAANVEVSGTKSEADKKSGYDTKVGGELKYSTQPQNYPDGKFTGTGATSTGNSNTIITLKKNEATLVTLYIWIEGADPNCVNQIQLDDLQMQLQFEKDESTN